MGGAAADPGPTALRVLLGGRRGRLVLGLIGTELATAFGAIAESAVLPLAADELHGAELFGAATAAPTLAGVLLLVLGPALMARLGASRALLVSTVVFVAGVLITCLAPAMVVVVLGRVLQGAGQGLVAGIGYGVIGGLYTDAARTRVLALLASVWLLPAVLGPPINSAVASVAGWRWAMAWPAVLFVAARLVVGSAAALVPASSAASGVLPVRAGAAATAGLVLASASGALPAPLAEFAWGTGLAVSAIAAARVLTAFAGADGSRRRLVLLYALVCVAYFGGQSLVSLEVVVGLGGSVLAAGIAYTGSAIAWSLIGLTPLPMRWAAVAPVLGASGAAVAAAAIAALTLGGVRGTPAVVPVVLCGVLAGCSVGVAFPAMNAAGFEGAPSGDSLRIGTAFAFGDVFAIAWSGLLGTGLYSLTAGAVRPPVSIGSGYALVAAVGATAVAAAVRRHRRLRRPAA